MTSIYELLRVATSVEVLARLTGRSPKIVARAVAGMEREGLVSREWGDRYKLRVKTQWACGYCDWTSDRREFHCCGVCPGHCVFVRGVDLWCWNCSEMNPGLPHCCCRCDGSHVFIEVK